MNQLADTFFRERVIFFQHGFQEIAGAAPVDIRDNARQLDVPAFQHLLEAVQFPAALPNEALAVPRHFPQLALLPAGDVACADEPVFQQVGNPFGIPDVGLAAGDVLDVPGIGDDDIEAEKLEDVVKRFPVGTSAFHGNHLALAIEQPF